MNSMERVVEFAELEQEPPYHATDGGDGGALPARTKTGVVGRTGAGKSTLTLALLRMVPTASGRFLIDGVDINLVRLDRLRGALTIVPQERARCCATRACSSWTRRPRTSTRSR